MIEVQNATATGLARLLAAASRAPDRLPADFAEKLVTTDPGAAGILFTYGDLAKVPFGGRFLHRAATVLTATERKDPNCWETRSLTTAFGDGPDSTGLRDPVRGLLRAAENSPESAQAVLGDSDLLKHFLTDQDSAARPGRGRAVAELLTEATVNHARDTHPATTPKEQSIPWNAAKISSLAIHTTADAGKIIPEARLPLAQIFSMYLPDIEKSYRIGTAPENVDVQDHTGKRGYPNPYVTVKEGWPRYGALVRRGDSRRALNAIGSDGTSRKLIGRTVMAYSAYRMDQAALEDKTNGTKDRLPSVAADSAYLTGAIISDLADGDISDAKNLDETREKKQAKVASVFLTPLDFTVVGKALDAPYPIITDFFLSEAKNLAAGDSGKPNEQIAIDRSNDGMDAAKDRLTLQAFESARIHGHLSPTDREQWPQDPKTGAPVPVNEMTETQRGNLASDVGSEIGTYAEKVRQGVETKFRANVISYR